MSAGWSSNERLRLGVAKSDVSLTYSNADSILNDCQLIRSVMIVRSSSKTNIFLLCKSAWSRVKAAVSLIRGSSDSLWITSRPKLSRRVCVATDPLKCGLSKRVLSTGESLERPVSIRPLQYAARSDPAQTSKRPCHGSRENENSHAPLLGFIEV